jgi:hypothetical protein
MPPERITRTPGRLDPDFPYAIPNGVIKYETDLAKESVVINWRAKNVQTLARKSRYIRNMLRDCGIIFRIGSKVLELNNIMKTYRKC